MTGNRELRLTGMGYSVGDDGILTYVPTWDDGQVTGAHVTTVPQMSVTTAIGTSRAAGMDLPSFDEMVDAMYNLQQGQRHLTPAFSSPYIDKPIKTFFVKGWTASASMAQRTLMADAAMLNYALGLSRGKSMGLIERMYREVRHLVADVAMMVAQSAQSAPGGDPGDGAMLDDAERQALAPLLSDPDANVPWVVGIGWLCCWHDHMATKKDFSSGILKAWFSQVESRLKVIAPMPWEEFVDPGTVALVSDIGMQCLRSCWVISDEDGELSDVLSSRQEWDAMFARELDVTRHAKTIEMMTAELRDELDSDAPEEEPDDIIPESMMSLKREIDSMTPQDIRPGDE